MDSAATPLGKSKTNAKIRGRIAPAQRAAQGLLDLVAGVPDHGIEVFILRACSLAEVGVELLRPELRRSDREAHIVLAGGFALPGPACSNLDALRQHTEVGLAVGSLLDIGQDVDFSPDADSAQVALVTSVGLLCDVSNCGHDSLLWFRFEDCSSGDARPFICRNGPEPLGRNDSEGPEGQAFLERSVREEPHSGGEKKNVREGFGDGFGQM